MPGAEHWIFKRPIVPNDERKTTGFTGTIQICNTQLECLNLTSISIGPVGASYLQIFGNLAFFILKTHGFASQLHSWFAFFTFVTIAPNDVPKLLNSNK